MPLNLKQLTCKNSGISNVKYKKYWMKGQKKFLIWTKYRIAGKVILISDKSNRMKAIWCRRNKNTVQFQIVCSTSILETINHSNRMKAIWCRRNKNTVQFHIVCSTSIIETLKHLICKQNKVLSSYLR
jgi:hypothetical protein